MGVICWDGNELATDSQSSCQHMRRAGSARRLYAASDLENWKVENKRAVAFAYMGEGTPGPWIVEALTQGLDHKTTLGTNGSLSFQCIIICEDCAFCWRYLKEGRGAEEVNNLMPIEAPFALGSGMQYAVAVMSIGKTAKQAVEVASKWDLNSGGLVQSYRRQLNVQKEEVVTELKDLAEKALMIAEGNFDNPEKLKDQVHEVHRMALKLECRAVEDLFPHLFPENKDDD